MTGRTQSADVLVVMIFAVLRDSNNVSKRQGVAMNADQLFKQQRQSSPYGDARESGLSISGDRMCRGDPGE